VARKSSARGPVRFIVVGICAIAVLVAFVAVLRQSLSGINADADVVARERAGVVFLHPMTGLIGALVEAQSAAVRGEKVDEAGVTKSLDSVGRANSKVGGLLDTEQRYADLRTHVEDVLKSPDKGLAAYLTYSGVVTLAMDLVRRVGDTSHLVHDPDLDSYYLMDSALVQLPSAMIQAGQAADVARLAGGNLLTGEDAVKAAVARHGVAEASERVSDGLYKSVDSTSRTVLGVNITPQLDAFRAAADVFSPPTMLSQLAGNVDAKVLQDAAHEVFAAALPLAHKLLGELDAVLFVRATSLADSQHFTVWVATGVAALLVVAVLVLLLTRGRARSRRSLADAGVGPSANQVPDVALAALTDVRRLMDADDFAAGRPRSRTRADAR
jgi:hypothetical protein